MLSLTLVIGPLSLSLSYGVPEDASEYLDLSTEHERLPVGFAPPYYDEDE